MPVYTYTTIDGPLVTSPSLRVFQASLYKPMDRSPVDPHSACDGAPLRPALHGNKISIRKPHEVAGATYVGATHADILFRCQRGTA